MDSFNPFNNKSHLYFVLAIAVIVIVSIWLLYYLSVYRIPKPIIGNNIEEMEKLRHNQRDR